MIEVGRPCGYNGSGGVGEGRPGGGATIGGIIGHQD